LAHCGLREWFVACVGHCAAVNIVFTLTADPLMRPNK
jgi:hypothetical protein